MIRFGKLEEIVSECSQLAAVIIIHVTSSFGLPAVSSDSTMLKATLSWPELTTSELSSHWTLNEKLQAE